MAKKPEGKRFKYNLQSVLKVREIRERQEKDKFAEANKKYLDELEKEDQLKKFQSTKYDELRGRMDKGQELDFHNILQRTTHLENLKKQVEEQEKSRQEAEDKKEEQRQELIKAVKKKKVIEKDKDNKKQSWKKWRDKEQGKFLDEIATIRHEHKKSGSDNDTPS